LEVIGDCAFASGSEALKSVTSIYLPPSVLLIDGDPFIFSDAGSRNEKTTINAQYDSYAAWWARTNGFPYTVAPSQGELRAHPPELLYQYIPYEFIAKTRVPNNDGLKFWLTDGAGNPLELPAGLHLADGVADTSHTPGTIYGSPLDYTDFENGVTFTMHAQNIGGGFTASATFTIKLADTPDNDWLEANLNKYPITADPDTGAEGHIGEWDADSGEYVIGGAYDDVTAQIFYIGDITGDDGAPINSYDYFDSFWIDGVKKEIGTQYDAEDGSTRVTVLAKTIQDLDNGEHTAAAAFRRIDEGGDSNADAYADWNGSEIGDNLDVVAQNFTVKLTARPDPVVPGIPDDTGNTGDTDPASPTNPTGPTNPTDPAEPAKPTDPANPANPAEPTNPTNPAEPAKPTDPANPANPAEPAKPTDPANPANPTEPAKPTDPANPANPAEPTKPTDPANPANPTEPTNPTNPAEPSNPENPTNPISPVNPASPGVNDGTAAATEAAADPAAEGSDEVDVLSIGNTAAYGLPMDENGRLYFNLDGSGTPMELRIDIPLEEYENLFFDNALWAVGEDYTLRSGSTVLTIGAGRLERVAAGLHTLRAEFTDETVEITFDLMKNAPPASKTGAGAAEENPAGDKASVRPETENGGKFWPAAVAAALLCAGTAMITIGYRRKGRVME
jgi:hypothetical protein